MYEPNVKHILDRIGPTDKVLDIGGWIRPFNRANYVMDMMPYETRGSFAPCGSAQGGETEHFTKETWIQRDICDRTPYPFADKEIDFVICSHTLEDIRDPIWVCSEMVRIAKRGYIEVPSRVAESCRGKEPGQVGWTHHRWLITIEGNSIEFLQKYHLIHSHWRFSFPESFFRRLTEEQQVQWLFWEGSFQFGEKVLWNLDSIAAELEGFVQRINPRSSWVLSLDRHYRSVKHLTARALRKTQRVLGWS